MNNIFIGVPLEAILSIKTAGIYRATAMRLKPIYNQHTTASSLCDHLNIVHGYKYHAHCLPHDLTVFQSKNHSFKTFLPM